MLLKITYFFFYLLCIFSSVRAQADAFNKALQNVTEIIVHDVFSPVAASRIYAYVTIAAYETMCSSETDFISLQGKLHQFPKLPPVTKNDSINLELAGIFALYYTSKAFIFSEEMLQIHVDRFMMEARKKFQEKTIITSKNFAISISEKIINWAASDGYAETRSLPRFQPSEKTGAWIPTAPDYADATEPFWGQLRSFVIDSTFIIEKSPFIPFDTMHSSQFFKEAYAVYTVGNELTEEQKSIARFWDDNPFSTKYIGHLQFAEKKISPAGHWLDIGRVAIENNNTELLRAVQIYMLLSVAMADAFIYCWREKYETDVIRPLTYINQYIDAKWSPFLQTPPFPEFPSGHSTVSAASATILTHFFGTNMQFSDASETIYGLPVRTYNSFEEAANEASISRFYGGIHFQQSLIAGSFYGKQIAQQIIHKLLQP